jgi:hypothetical protein
MDDMVAISVFFTLVSYCVTINYVYHVIESVDDGTIGTIGTGRTERDNRI